MVAALPLWMIGLKASAHDEIIDSLTKKQHFHS